MVSTFIPTANGQSGLPKFSTSAEILHKWRMLLASAQSQKVNVVIVTDVDGTLIPDGVPNALAFPTPKMVETLTRFMELGDNHWMVTGKSVEQVEERFPGLPFHVNGLFDLQQRLHGQEVVPHASVTHRVIESLVAIHEKLSAMFEPDTPGHEVVHQGSITSAHTLGLERLTLQVEVVWKAFEEGLKVPIEVLHELAQTHDMDFISGDGYINFRPHEASKADIIREILKDCPPNTIVICAGDGSKDKAMFGELAELEAQGKILGSMCYGIAHPNLKVQFNANGKPDLVTVLEGHSVDPSLVLTGEDGHFLLPDPEAFAETLDALQDVLTVEFKELVKGFKGTNLATGQQAPATLIRFSVGL